MTDSLPLSRRTALQIAAATVAATSLNATRRSRADEAKKSVPNDRRLGPLKDLNAYFPWTPSATVAEWEKRAEFVRRQVLVSTGLWPMPTKRPLNTVIQPKVERDDYTVEGVILETGDGLFCTGSLYRPKAAATKKRPGILCPHGHWATGRFHRHADKQFENELKTKAETYESGRHPLQARCVQLARMGCTVFLYDMLGVADSASPLTGGLIHGFAQQRAALSNPDRWGLFSAQSELRCLNALGLQTWNSVRALDWLSALDDVDPSRIGVTGASGGGTQTFMLGAVDSRPAAFFPAVMVSTSMQGGCTCENATYLRVGTGNIELAALAAPRPLGLSAADDWTRELETKGLPELKQHYALLGVPDRVEGKYFPFEHNYNQHARKMMYEFFNRHFGLGLNSPIEERDFVPLTIEEATVWQGSAKKPEATEENELRVLRGFARDQDAQLASLTPRDAATLGEFRRVIGGAWDVIIGRKLPGKDEFTQTNTQKDNNEDLMRFHTLIRLEALGEEVPARFFLPKNWTKQVAIWVTDTGKQSLLKADGTPVPAVQKLLDAGISVALPDLLYQGDFLADGKPLTAARSVPNPREFAGYTLGYNHPLFVQRVHDILSLIAFCRFSKYEPDAVHVVGTGKVGGALAAAAAAQAGKAVDKLAVATGGFRFGSITEIRDPMLVPGAVRYGDIPGLLALNAPRTLWLGGEAAVPALVTAAYAAAGSPAQPVLYQGEQPEAALAAWLVG